MRALIEQLPGTARDDGWFHRAREILDERYASGEITTDEYRDMRSQIGR